MISRYTARKPSVGKGPGLFLHSRSRISASRAGVWRLACESWAFFSFPISMTWRGRALSGRVVSLSIFSVFFRKAWGDFGFFFGIFASKEIVPIATIDLLCREFKWGVDK